MTLRTILLTATIGALAAATIAAQAPAGSRGQRPRSDAPAPSAPQRVETPRREGQPVNIKIDVTITDQRAAGATPLKKTVSVVTADNMSGFIRTTAIYRNGNIGPVPLNVDTSPALLPDGKIRLRLNLQYDLPTSVPGADPSEGAVAPPPGDSARRALPPDPVYKTQIQENLSLVVENGKPVIAAQSADPIGDRQVTIEVKATVLR
jgi:hypothetical protein